MLFLFSVGLVMFAVSLFGGYYDVIVSRFGDEGVSVLQVVAIYGRRISRNFHIVKNNVLGATTNAETVGSHVTHNTLCKFSGKWEYWALSLYCGMWRCILD